MVDVKPNLFVVGAAKSGTTSLYYYLSQHSDIYMSPVKEPHYFSTVTNINARAFEKPKAGETYHTRVIAHEEDYIALFKNGRGFRYRGEASPSYLYDESSAKKIKSFNAEAKIIIILREPLDRAVSHFNMSYSLGLESESDFHKALLKDQINNNKVWGSAHLYVELGHYYKQVMNFFQVFPLEQIYLLKFEDLKNSPRQTMENLFKFLCIDSSVAQNLNTEKKNTTVAIRHKHLQKSIYLIKHNRILNWIKSSLPHSFRENLKRRAYSSGGTNLTISNECERYLASVYHEDKLNLKRNFGIEW